MPDYISSPSLNPRTFPQVLATLRFGTLSDELTNELQALVNKCQDTGRAGVLTLKIGLKPGKGGQIEVFDEISVKSPKEDRSSTLMFATPEGNLTRQDPRQTALDLSIRSVDKDSGEIRMVAKG